jgi:hypothetical protein
MEVIHSIQQEADDNGFIEATKNNNFADHVMFYMDSLKRRGFSTYSISLKDEKTYELNQITCLYKYLHNLHSMRGNVPNPVMEWARQRHSLGIMEFMQFKTGTDRMAFLLAAFILVQVELCKFDENGSKLASYIIKDTKTENKSFILINRPQTPMGLLQSSTKNPLRLEQAKQVRDELNLKIHTGFTFTFRDPSASTTKERIELHTNELLQAKQMFLDYIRKSPDKRPYAMRRSAKESFEFLIGMYHRFGKNQSSIPSDVVRMIQEECVKMDSNQYNKLLTA